MNATMTTLTKKLSSLTDRELVDCLALAKKNGTDRDTVYLLAAEAASREIDEDSLSVREESNRLVKLWMGEPEAEQEEWITRHLGWLTKDRGAEFAGKVAKRLGVTL